ncbi:general transcription factor IIE subunit 1-like [Ctenocephalides felis]|uniref:general transcription factor IIE subunit 1-like n=1 Tax=Ctenocephalides felis TaxID=7515 RepID=UPI000E6E3E1A|nr:general transcription factor IIE subunit 1-like [Ctenocephalides felis]
MSEERYVTEVPSSLKQLARLVVRGFYSIEDALIIDMLVRNPCMKEDDICELLKFERKMLRARIATLKSDKFIQVRLKMETGIDGKAQKVNYYFINYKTFVNVVKYKLDLMRKRMETEERDATSRASFKCLGCDKTFTDLEADQLFNFATSEFCCTFCNSAVEEDLSALPKKDSRLLLAKFNEQLEPLYMLLRQVEGLKLAPEILEPEPVDINTIRGITSTHPSDRNAGEPWSGEATRGLGFAVEEARVDISIGDNVVDTNTAARKDRPIWMTESTVVSAQAEKLPEVAPEPVNIATNNAKAAKKVENDIMSVLLQHEKQSGNGSGNATENAVKGLGVNNESSDSSADESEYKDIDNTFIPDVGTMDSESDDNIPTVTVGGKTIELSDVTDEIIASMTPQEKETYIQVYQENYSHIYDC